MPVFKLFNLFNQFIKEKDFFMWLCGTMLIARHHWSLPSGGKF